MIGMIQAKDTISLDEEEELSHITMPAQSVNCVEENV